MHYRLRFQGSKNISSTIVQKKILNDWVNLHTTTETWTEEEQETWEQGEDIDRMVLCLQTSRKDQRQEKRIEAVQEYLNKVEKRRKDTGKQTEL